MVASQPLQGAGEKGVNMVMAFDEDGDGFQQTQQQRQNNDNCDKRYLLHAPTRPACLLRRQKRALVHKPLFEALFETTLHAII